MAIKYKILKFCGLAASLSIVALFASGITLKNTIEDALASIDIIPSMMQIEALGKDTVVIYASPESLAGVAYLQKRGSRWQLIENHALPRQDWENELPVYEYAKLPYGDAAILFGFIEVPYYFEKFTVLNGSEELEANIIAWENNLRLWYLLGNSEVTAAGGRKSPTLVGTSQYDEIAYSYNLNYGDLTENEFIKMIVYIAGEGELEAELNLTEKMLQYYPDSIEGHLMAGQIYLYRMNVENRYEVAKTHLLNVEDKVLAGNMPRTSVGKDYSKEELLTVVYFYLGEAAMNQDQKEEALAYFIKSYQIADEMNDVYNRDRAKDMISVLSE